MKLVIDSNILISALIKDSITRKIIFESKFELYYPAISLHEIKKHRDFIINKSELESDDFDKLFHTILDKINLIPYSRIKSKIKQAKEIFEDIDKDDVIFIALALSIENEGIWTDDTDFNKQDKIKIWKTENVLKILM